MTDKKPPLTLPDENLSDIAAVFMDSPPFQPSLSAQGNHLLVAMQYITQLCGLPYQEISITPQMRPSEAVQGIANQSGFRVREVTLDENWRKRDHDVLLAFYSKDNSPCVLIPTRKGQYEIWDPQTQKTLELSDDTPLSTVAFYFYKPLPNEIMNRRKIFKYVYAICKRDFWDAIALQMIFSALGLIIPIATGALFNHVVPNANKSMLLQFTLVLFAITFASAAFQLGQSFSFLRLRIRVNTALQASIWDRLLKLPLNFYRQYTSGDLADRAGGIDVIQQALTGAVMGALTNSLMGIFLLALLFYYSTLLASLVLVFTLILTLSTIIINIMLLRYYRPMAQIAGKINGLLMQLLTNISKLRIANAQVPAFTLWSKLFLENTRLSYRVGKIKLYFNVIKNLFNIITVMCIFTVVVQFKDILTFGDFIAFNAASSQFFMIAISLASVVNTLISIIPTYERATPILEALDPTPANAKVLPKLEGDVQLSDLQFRYQDNTPLVLNHISLSIKPGEFLAIVGPSGSGKSTLLRLLLGFEQPNRGEVTFDKIPLKSLNNQQLRSHMGVVLQDARLLPGTLFENIVASRPMDEKAAWEAAKLAALDQDIEDMPMQMHTLIMEGGKTLSGGQKQRLLIARAIAGQPDMVVFDEATSAIDNVTANRIHENLDKMNITRIVCAHRLHTIQKADRIIVLSQGEIVQEGHFETLSKVPGLFQELMKAQMTESDGAVGDEK